MRLYGLAASDALATDFKLCAPPTEARRGSAAVALALDGLPDASCDLFVRPFDRSLIDSFVPCSHS